MTVELELLGAAGGVSPGRGSQAFLVAGSLAIDAGSLASGLALERVPGVRSVLLTHRHLDHLRELPIFLDNAMGLGAAPLEVVAEAGTLRCLFRHLFNWELWPDPRRFPGPPARFTAVRPGRSFVRGGLRIAPVRLFHTVPTVGWVLRRGRRAAALLGDTGFRPAVFRRLAAVRDLGFLAIECSFPDRLGPLARTSRHLTPALLARGLGILRRAHPRLRVLAVHVKPPWAEETEAELRRLEPGVGIARDGMRLRIL